MIERKLVQQNIYNLVFSISASKGLEFKDVLVLDFFRELIINRSDSSDIYKAWKSLLQHNTADTSDSAFSFPQLEIQLKLLYTGSTRACNRLIFIETNSTSLSSLVFRWMRTQDLAEELVPLQGNQIILTPDEWRGKGIECALSAEGINTMSFLQRALNCFQQAADRDLIKKIIIQMEYHDLITRVKSYDEILHSKDELTCADMLIQCSKYGLKQELSSLSELLEVRSCDTNYYKSTILPYISL